MLYFSVAYLSQNLFITFIGFTWAYLVVNIIRYNIIGRIPASCSHMLESYLGYRLRLQDQDGDNKVIISRPWRPSLGQPTTSLRPLRTRTRWPRRPPRRLKEKSSCRKWNCKSWFWLTSSFRPQHSGSNPQPLSGILWPVRPLVWNIV